ncbi:hypothetical protein Avbf_10432 [Armadillidium vulgare]|nr:hypothetical protein Avbf_10432 [Armadillidium vulgare]
MDDTHIFSILDHVLFFGLLTISTIIGLVSAFKGNRSPEEFFLGNRSLNPVAYMDLRFRSPSLHISLS